MSFVSIVLFAAFVSLSGWLAESLIASIRARRPISRGMLFGPFLPAYGFSAVIIILVSYFMDVYHPLLYSLICIAAMLILLSLLEWLTGKFYGVSLYRREKTPGRRLLFALIRALWFYALSLLSVYVYNPLVAVFSDSSPVLSRFISSVLIMLFLSELLGFIFRFSKIKKGLLRLDEIAHEASTADGYEAIYKSSGVADTLTAIYSDDSENTAALRKELDSAMAALNPLKRMLEAYPHMRFSGYERYIKIASTAKSLKSGGGLKTLGRGLHTLFLTSSEINEEKNVLSFAHGLNLYKLFWVFLLGSVIGWFCEIVFCYVTNGYIESRQGMLYGPFSQVYGFGAVIMLLLLYKLRKGRDIWIFLCSMIIGGIFESACSYIQEAAFGTVSWDYTSESHSIGGRTSLLYMFFWGVLGCVFIKLIYPKLSSLIEGIPNRLGKQLTVILLIFLLADGFLSASAVYRQSQRHEDIAPQNAFQQFLDEKYDDEYLAEVYPNMKRVD